MLRNWTCRILVTDWARGARCAHNSPPYGGITSNTGLYAGFMPKGCPRRLKPDSTPPGAAVALAAGATRTDRAIAQDSRAVLNTESLKHRFFSRRGSIR